MPILPMTTVGYVSTFGGPHDAGMGLHEGLALIHYVREKPEIFLPGHDPDSVALGHWLDPSKFYIAMRWPRGLSYVTIRDKLVVMVRFGDKSFRAQPVDWGPGVAHRLADLSPGLAEALGVDTDRQTVSITLSLQGATPS